MDMDPALTVKNNDKSGTLVVLVFNLDSWAGPFDPPCAAGWIEKEFPSVRATGNCR